MASNEAYSNSIHSILRDLAITAVQGATSYYLVAPLAGLTPISALTFSLVGGVTYSLFPKSLCEPFNWVKQARNIASIVLPWFATGFVGLTWTVRQLTHFIWADIKVKVGILLATGAVAVGVLTVGFIAFAIFDLIKGRSAQQPLSAST